jgi:hypothetical protein
VQQTREERQQLRTQERAQRVQEQRQLRELQAKQRQELRQKGLSRTERNELRAQQRKQLQDLRAQQRDQRQQAREQRQQLQQRQEAREQRQDLRAQRRAQRVTAQQARQGRFAAQLQAKASNRAARRAARIAARQAWRRGLYASFVAWAGPVYWPYAYSDVFDYTFFPYAYDPAFWAYAYDDFFFGIFFPYGAPITDYAYEIYEGPYRDTTGSAVPGRVTRAARDLCGEPGKGVTAWPFEQIAQAVRPNREQQRLFEELKAAAAQAGDRFKQACPDDLPMTPPGRLQAMVMRLQATLDAVKIVRPPLERFYESLSDEQRARFNEIGPDLGKDRERAARNERQDQQADCGGEKSGLTAFPIDRVEELLQPTDAQLGALDRLDEAMSKAVDVLETACPTTVPLTPVGRLEVMQQRLEAMIEAANTVRPALEDFYASLSNEQKAKFNRLGRDQARGG